MTAKVDGEMQGGELDAACEVVSAQFAGGMTIAQLVEEWEREASWIEGVIRRALLEYIPAREGGLKQSRTQVREARREDLAEIRAAQGALPLPPVAHSAKKVIGYGENGYRVGEGHQNVRISDEVVDDIRRMHEEEKLTPQQIADELGLNFYFVHNICHYRRRATTPVRFRRVPK